MSNQRRSVAPNVEVLSKLTELARIRPKLVPIRPDSLDISNNSPKFARNWLIWQTSAEHALDQISKEERIRQRPPQALLLLHQQDTQQSHPTDLNTSRLQSMSVQMKRPKTLTPSGRACCIEDRLPFCAPARPLSARPRPPAPHARAQQVCCQPARPCRFAPLSACPPP